eukprot:4920793-Prymnesium_polylepis.1
MNSSLQTHFSPPRPGSFGIKLRTCAKPNELSPQIHAFRGRGETSLRRTLFGGCAGLRMQASCRSGHVPLTLE